MQRELVSEEQEEDIDTLGGLVFSIAGRIPARGELVRHPSGIEFEVLEADPRRIKKLRIHVAERGGRRKRRYRHPRPARLNEPSGMIRAATWVAGLAGARRALFAMLIGALSVLAFAPIHAWPVLFLTFGALVWLLDGCHARHDRLGQRLKCAGIVGFWFGFGYFLAGLYWIAEAFLVEPWRHGWLIPFVMTAMPGGMALFFAAAGALAMLLWQPGAGRVFALAIAVGLAEYARGHVLTGLPWNLVGYGLLATLPLMQLAALFGVYALSLLAVLLFASPLAIFAPRDSRLGGGKGGIALACTLLLLLGLGYVWGERRLAGRAAGKHGYSLAHRPSQYRSGQQMAP